MSTSQEDFLRHNLANPKGKIGYKVSEYMALQSYELNAWAIKLLDIKKDDVILEVGFGLGWAIRDMAKLAEEGFIAGIDCSELMVQKAKKANKEMIAQGRVDLRHGDVSMLPVFDKTFDKILAVNNIMYWENPIKALENLKEVLNPGGWISIVLQRTDEAFRKGKCDVEIDYYRAALQEAGFANTQVAIDPLTLQKPNQKKQMIAAISIRGFNELVIPAITTNLTSSNLLSANQGNYHTILSESLFVQHKATNKG